MSAKDDLLFLTSSRCGSLYYHNVYSYYDEPLIFTALNEYDQLFFCYSLGCDEQHDRWIIVPASQEKVNRLEQKDIPIVHMIKPSVSAKVLLTKIGLDTNEVSEEFVVAKKLPYKMPQDNVFIRENINYDGRRKHSHRIRIAKKSNKDIISETLNQVSEVFGEFCRHYLKKHEISVSFYPRDAVEGSFVYRVKTATKDEIDFRTKGYELLSKVSSHEDFLSSLEAQEIDLRIVRKLFDLIGSNDIEIQLIDEDSTQTILGLEPNYVEELLPDINDKLGSYLDSTMVPQADSLERIRLYLNIVDRNRVVTAKELGVEPRQVSYYRDACKLLSLIHDYSSLTPLGMKVAASQNDEEWVKIIQRQFEESDCGHIWMLKQDVSSILDIQENSAAEFLIENCNGLSDNTSRRRAQTLKSWVRKFKEFA
ncbi:MULTISPECIES: DUF6575 domain-containing protein [Vibrio]|uniref:DUF6575 domain-containing protein n=1 Tax=Vibrio cholerae TaxID=666 RepID=UPI00019F701E|nr:DUF6575 domain-containing protein [Vibrio cholerae]EEO07038.1 hypothetical protein VIF_001333 [Vibrio cholerae TM 11079-80]EGQ8012685.1 hypothetical protein [Vibrio cholerae]EGQ9392303.1 hypothetical protein [Vibrio cholerae]EGR0539590.1 hypothetical protein [Vibrio cholerae]EGR09191.1 hypothetical protein VCHE48_1559 [Vibrio cholerae HE48]